MFEQVEVNSERWFDLTPLKNEEFRDIQDYEGMYQVSNYGRVKRLKRRVNTVIRNSNYRYIKEKILTSLNNGKDYLFVTLVKNKTKEYLKIHRLVAQAFIPNQNGLPCVNHKDYNRKNNKVDNLEWCSLQYNNEYSHNKPIYQKDIDGLIIKKWKSATEASKKLHITISNISSCCNGKRQIAGGYKWEYRKEKN